MQWFPVRNLSPCIVNLDDTRVAQSTQSEYEGARLAAETVRNWESLHGLIDQERYARLLALPQYRAGQAIQYFDQNNGIARYTVFLNRQQVGAWLADDDLPSGVRNGSTSTRHTLYGLALRPGDTIRIEGRPNAGEPAPLDYIQLDPQSR
jgi:hypothetical protein